MPQVTNVCFGGPGRRDLFVTSARRGLEGEALARAPLSGGLFRIAEAGQGMAANAAAG